MKNLTKTLKIVSGALFILGGLCIGFLKKTRLKSFSFVLTTCLSIALIAVGVVLFVSGVDDFAVGIVGEKLQGERVSSFKFDTPDDFKNKIKETLQQNKFTRRLHFTCKDNSEQIRLYRFGGRVF
jgi:hypothetical protein